MPASLQAQATTVTAEPVECIPIGDNAVAWARVDNNVPDTTTRLYFRRLNDVVEDFYYVEMNPTGDGRYWGTFPKAEDHPLDRHDLEERREEAYRDAARDDDNDGTSWASWWRAKDSSDDRDPNGDLDDSLIRERASLGKAYRRDWMFTMDEEAFQDWLEQLENEPAEYFVTVVDGQGRAVAQSEVKVVEVKAPDHCEVAFTPQQAGEKENLTVGESGEWQRGEPVFHWRCDGVVSRIDPYNVIRSDGVCRACVIAIWERLLPLAALPTMVTCCEVNVVSPSTP